MRHFRLLFVATLALICIATAPFARAQDFPKRPITLVIPFPPGGLGDLVARRLSQPLTDILKQPIIVDYKPGGGGTIGASYTKSAPADGYTLMIANSPIMAINPSLMAAVSYDPVKDFTPITMLVSTSHVLVVPAGSDIKTFADLIARAKDKKTLSFASAGVGGGGHLLGEMLKQKTAGDFVHVPYKGAAPAMQDVLGGRIDFYFESVALATPHVTSGGVRALAVSSRKRLAAYPDIPTLTELGYADVSADSWFALFAPAGLPKPIVDQLNAAFGKALGDPAVIKPLTDQSLDVLPGTPGQLAETLNTDLARYGKLIREIGAKVE
jgi:tripartite-type tricarboxylate transporter receptor subunit TctC